jgi:hypothetical protein
MNDDLIGKVYRNGDGGRRYRVVAVDSDYPNLVKAERISDGASATAVAAFVRECLED